jgi:hypothetical protein
MKIKSINTDEKLWEKVLEKAQANCQSLSAVITVLLKKWLNGEIKLNKEK